MGCACQRSNSLDKGNYSIYKADSPAQLLLQIIILEPEAKRLHSGQNFSSKHKICLQNEQIIRMETSCEILDEGFLFSLNEIEFDEARIDMILSPMSFHLTFDEKFTVDLTLYNLKYSLYAMSKEQLILKDENNNEINCDVYYALIGPFFYSMRSLSLDFLTQEEQIEIIYQLLYKRNNEQNNFGKGKLQVRLFLGDFKTDVKMKLFEKLVEIPGGKSCKAVKEFIIYYNPYKLKLQLSFKNFMKNIVAFDAGLEEYAKNLIQSNIDDYLIYENKESLIIMLKSALFYGEDRNNYFENLIKKGSGEQKIKEMLNTPDIFENIFLPNFEKKCLKTVKICDILLKLKCFEEFLSENYEKYIPLVNIDEINEMNKLHNFLEFNKKKKQSSK